MRNIGAPRVDEMNWTIEGREMLNPNYDEHKSESNCRDTRLKFHFNSLCKTDNKKKFVVAVNVK